MWTNGMSCGKRPTHMTHVSYSRMVVSDDDSIQSLQFKTLFILQPGNFIDFFDDGHSAGLVGSSQRIPTCGINKSGTGD